MTMVCMSCGWKGDKCCPFCEGDDINELDDHRQFATDHAAGFKDRILIQMGAVLDQHNSAVVDFACAMQARLDAAEGLLAQIAACGRRPNADGTWASVKARTELMNRVDELVAQSKARTA